MKRVVNSKTMIDRFFIDDIVMIKYKFSGGQKPDNSRCGVKARKRVLLPRELAEKVLIAS